MKSHKLPLFFLFVTVKVLYKTSQKLAKFGVKYAPSFETDRSLFK